MGAIYISFCRATGRVYVGQTTLSGWKERYRTAFSTARNKAKRGTGMARWQRALAKYGESGFVFRDLMTNVAAADLDELERFFIRHFDSRNPKKGYNTDSGGALHKSHAEESKRKIGAAHRRPVRWYHREHGVTIAGIQELARSTGAKCCSGLHAVRHGRAFGCLGWVCLDAPVWHGDLGSRPALWTHEEYGAHVATPQILRALFPSVGLCKSHLSAVRLGKRSSCAGWRYRRPATLNEEQAMRILWADLGMNRALGDSNRKIPRVG